MMNTSQGFRSPAGSIPAEALFPVCSAGCCPEPLPCCCCPEPAPDCQTVQVCTIPGPTGPTGPQGPAGPIGPQGPTGAAGPAGAMPAPASADFASTIAQTLAPNGYYAPVPMTIHTPYYVSQEEDGYTFTLQRQGLYFVTYSITPATGANANASVALLQPKGGNPPPALLLSNRPMTANNTGVTAGFVASFAAGEQLFLGVNSSETVTLAANPRGSANATLSIVQVG